MRRPPGIGLVFCVAVIVACRSKPSATLVIRHARVYKVDSTQPWAHAVAVQGERIVYVGSDSRSIPGKTLPLQHG
jgi:hypothetical protein